LITNNKFTVAMPCDYMIKVVVLSCFIFIVPGSILMNIVTT